MIGILAKIPPYLRYHWPLGRTLRLLLAVLLFAEAIGGDFPLLIPISLWLGWQVYQRQGCGGDRC